MSHARLLNRARAFAQEHGSLADLGRSSGLPSQLRDAWNDLSPDEQAELMAGGFIPDRREARWRRGISELTNFIAIFGHSNPASRYVAPSGYRLGNFVAFSRLRFRRGELRPHCVEDLETLGLVWELPISADFRARRFGIAREAHSDVAGEAVRS